MVKVNCLDGCGEGGGRLKGPFLCSISSPGQGGGAFIRHVIGSRQKKLKMCASDIFHQGSSAQRAQMTFSTNLEVRK